MCNKIPVYRFAPIILLCMAGLLSSGCTTMLASNGCWQSSGARCPDLTSTIALDLAMTKAAVSYVADNIETAPATKAPSPEPPLACPEPGSVQICSALDGCHCESASLQ